MRLLAFVIVCVLLMKALLPAVEMSVLTLIIWSKLLLGAGRRGAGMARARCRRRRGCGLGRWGGQGVGVREEDLEMGGEEGEDYWRTAWR